MRNLELQELQQNQQGLLLISQLFLLRELVRGIRNDKRGIPFGLLNSCWSKKCILASSPHLWTYAKSLLIVVVSEYCYD